MYSRVVDDLGKGIEVLRRSVMYVPVQNATVNVIVDQVPVKYAIKRIAWGSPAATNVTSMDVQVLASTDDTDTAPAAGNQLITQVTDFADKKVKTATLLALGQQIQAANSILKVQCVGGADVPTAPLTVIIEWDPVDVSYGAYDAGGSSKNTYN